MMAIPYPTMYNYLYNWPDSDDDQDPPPICDPDSPINPVGCVQPESESESVRFLGKIDASDLDNYPKADCIYQKLDQTGTMKSVISKFAGEQTDYNLDITVAPIPNDDGGGPTLGKTYSNFGNSKPINITINENIINKVPNLVLALTFLHEGIHAEMYRKVKFIGGYDNLNKSNFPGLYDFWHRKGKNSQHEQMAAFYLNTLVSGLSEYDNHQHSTEFYESLAYHGLKGTVMWKGLLGGRQKQVDDDFDKIFQTGSYQCN